MARGRPSVRAQIHPRALEIIEPFFKISDRVSADGVPDFRGVPDEVWDRIFKSKPKEYKELYEILTTDYPTFAALGQKIWAKKVGHLLPFVFNKTQLLQWDAMAQRIASRKPLFFVILKARQLGMSTLINGWCHWNVWRLRDIEVLMVGHEKPLVISFIDRLRIFHEELPKAPYITRTLRSRNKEARVPKDELYYNETRSKASTVVAKNAESRGRSTIHNHLAEFGFYPDASGLLSALMPQLPSAGSPARLACSVIIESTPNGKNDLYHQWQIAKEPGSEWVAKFYPWFVADDEYYMTPPHGWKMDDAQREWAANLAHIRKKLDGNDVITPGQVYWYETTLETECGGDQDKMDAEYPSDDETCFLLKSHSIFKHDIRYLQQTVIEAERRAPEMFASRDIVCTKSFLRGELLYAMPPSPFGGRPMTLEQLKVHATFKEQPDGPLVLWEPPIKGHNYVIGIDSAAGLTDSDDSCGMLLDVTAGRQVGEYAGKIPPEKLADDMVALGWYFANQGTPALLYPEINSIGVVTMKRMKQIWQYPNLGREEKWDEIGVKPGKFGHYTNEGNKYIGVSFIIYLVRERFLAICSDALLAEMSTFIATKDRDGDEHFSGDNNSPDNRVMALVLAGLGIRQTPKLYSSMNLKSHQMMSTIDMGIHDAPSPIAKGSAVNALPEDVRRGLGLEVDMLSVPANPMRSVMGDRNIMPWTPAQRRLFAAQMNRGELSKKDFSRRMAEGTRKDVDKSGHARKKKARGKVRRKK